MEGEARTTLEGDNSMSLMLLACWRQEHGSLGLHPPSQC